MALADATQWLRSQGVDYMLVGGLAVAAQGQPRATADVDLMIAVDISRALLLVDDLATSPFRPLFDDIAIVVESSFILPLRHRTTNVKVDVAIGLSGFECQAISRAQQLELLGVTLPVATAEDLIIMKVLAGRPQDDQDVRGLAIAQSDRLDWEYCLRIGTELGEAIGQDLAGQIRALRDTGGKEL